MHIEIANAKLNEDVQLAQMLFYSYRDAYENKLKKDLTQEYLKSILNTTSRRLEPKNIVRVAKHEGTIIGSYTLHLPGSRTNKSFLKKRSVYLSTFAISPDYQKQGHADVLINDAVDIAKNHAEFLTIFVDKKAYKLQRFYENHLFIETIETLHLGIEAIGYVRDTKLVVSRSTFSL